MKFRQAQIRRVDRGSPRDRAEQALDASARADVIEVAHHHERGVVGHIEALLERLCIGYGGCLDLRQVAVKVVAVVPVGIGQHRQVDPRPGGVRLVEDVHLYLVANDALLIFQHHTIDDRTRHPVRVKPQHAVQGARGHRLVIVGEVKAG